MIAALVVVLGAPLLTLPNESRSSGDATLATFGLTSVGSSSDVPTAGYKFGSIYTLSGPGRTVSFSWYTRGGAADQRFVPVVYSVNSGGAPAGLLAQGTEVVVRASQPAGWVTSALPAVDLQPGRYLLGLLAGPTTHGAVTFYTATPGTNYWNANAYPTPSASWGALNVSAAAWSAYVTYQPALAATGPPVVQTPPSISGSAQAGQSLEADRGVWGGQVDSYAFQWRRCDSSGAGCVDIERATANSYLVSSSDVGATLRVVVSASNTAGSTSSTSGPTAVVQPAPATATFGVTSVGSSSDVPTAGYKFGSIYTLSGPGRTVSFSWYTRGGAADQRFVPVVYSVNSGGAPAGLLAQGTEVVVRASQPAGWVTSALPAVDLQPGRYLLGLLAGPTTHGAVTFYTATPGTNYWNANAYPTPSASWGALNVSAAAWSAYVTYQPALAATGPPVVQTPPTTTGSPVQNSVEATDNGSWTNSPTGYTYKWQRENSPGAGTYSDITGETAKQYVARGADLGLRIRAAVSASNADGSATAYSSPIGPIGKLTRFVDDFNRPNGALGLPWAATPWAKGSDTVPTISGNRSIDPSGSHQGAVSHLVGGPFGGRVKLRIMVPSKYNGPSDDGGNGSSDVALDYCLDPATGRGYRWQIDSDSGAFLRLWRHSAASSGYTAVAGPGRTGSSPGRAFGWTTTPHPASTASASSRQTAPRR